MDVKLPGLNMGDVHFKVPGGEVQITGKWFNYGIIFIVMILDLNMWKNQIFYDPYIYGQYTDNDGYIYTICNNTWLVNATREMVSYSWRWNSSNHWSNQTYGQEDHRTNSKYLGFPLSLKGIAFIPSLSAFLVFGYLAKRFSRDEEEAKNTQVEAFRVIKSTSDEDFGLYEDGEDDDDYRKEPRVERRISSKTVLKTTSNQTPGHSTTNRSNNNVSSNSNEIELDRFGQDIQDSVDFLPDENPVSEDETSLNGQINARLTMANIVRLKTVARRHNKRPAIQDNKLTSSPSSLDEDSDCEEKKSFERELSPFSSDSDDKESRLSFSNTSVKSAVDADKTDSDDDSDSDTPKTLSFDRLERSNHSTKRAQENWDKLKNRSALSFGDLFRTSESGAQGSQDSLQSMRDETFRDKETMNTSKARKPEHIKPETNFLRVPSRSKR